MSYIISTESCADILKSDMEKNGISCIVMEYILNDTPVQAVYDSPAEYAQFYDTLRMGVMPTTSQISPFSYQQYFNGIFLERGDVDIVHFSLSSGLSGSAQSAILTADDINAQRLNNGLQGRVHVVDTLSATQGMAMLIGRAVEMKKQGASAQQVVDAAMRDRHRIHHLISVTDLFHLRRGGRVSAVGAAVGTLLNISPILIIDAKGMLSVVGKAKGRSGVIKAFLRIMQKNCSGKDFYIAESDNPQFASELIDWLKDVYGADCSFTRGFIGPVVGSHTGGGTLGVVYLGEPRE